MSTFDEHAFGITPEQGYALVSLVRHTLLAKFNRKIPDEEKDLLALQLDNDALRVSCGSFVTLKIGGRLRGCIGSLVGQGPLFEGVRKNAVNAAFHDPRFRPLTNKEMDRISIEVSVLNAPRPLVYDGAEGLVSNLRPKVDGVTISKGLFGATFLPQVWDQLPDAEAFLSHLCSKAGLPADTWCHGDLVVETYQVQYFQEPHE